MVSTIKFSEFAAADLNNSTNKSAGLSGGANATTEIVVRWTTAGRPSAPFNGILGYNTDLSSYEYWDSVSAQWFQLGTGDTGTVTLVNTGTGLTGGPITDTGTISFAAIAANSLWANVTAGIAVPTVIPTATWLFTSNNLSDVPNKATARINLGLQIGVDVEAWSATLDTIAGLGRVPLDLGGTNANLTANVGGIFYSTATAGAILAGTATAGQMLRSGASAAPSWSTATYPATAGTSGNILTSDGTNWISSPSAGVGSPLTTKGDIYTFSTVNARLAIGSVDGQMLQVSSGAATGNAWSTASYPSVATSTGSLLYANGTNWIASTSLWPNTVGASGKFIISDGATNGYSTSTIPTSAGATAGKVLASDGTNYVLSSAAFPTSVGATGTILRSDGTNWVATTATYPATTTINRILYSSANNTISEISTLASSGLLTDGSGVPAWVTATGTGAPVLGTAPTISAPKINQINDQSQNLAALKIVGVASAVNEVTITSAITANGPNISATGTDTNINLNLIAKGTGSIACISSGAPVFTAGNPASAVNYMGVVGAIATGSPTLAVVGSDTNITLTINGKGTGGVALEGTATNDSASAGYVGEYTSSNVPFGSPVSITTATNTDITSISLTAGDWDVFGNVTLSYSTAGSVGKAWTNSTSVTAPDSSMVTQLNLTLEQLSVFAYPIPTQRYSLSATTTIYLSARAIFTTGTCSGSGSIYARRRR